MFLNDLKNRLQTYAVPSSVLNITNDVTTDQIDISTVDTSCFTTNLQADVYSVKVSCSTTNLTDVNLSTDSTKDFNLTNSKDDKATQTELKLSSSTPRKEVLRKKCEAADKRAKRAKLKYNNEKNIEDITYDDFQKLLYKFYPKPIADFMKTQGNNLDKKRNGNRYTKEFKIFCLNLYFKGSKAYRILSNTFILPSKRTLERIIQGLIIFPGYTKSFLPACNAAIIMVRGLTNKFKQPLGYFFLNSTIDADKLRNNYY
ncbi:PREDICTED: uncharacterized protein LOC108761832 [Trachymyrmex cornetzi]|uniref:uncharacterized protein LOC108761832 n=1 Tax=Trachymyrmex cornetzi TaxID=471704 RepID=UPI00084F0296|nr:PREDICTED: uncharacterized protein LOC108761832 [Trachymyrmex cornetzi]